MGNSSVRYISNNDAVEIIGSQAWTSLRLKVERQGKALDFEFFSNLLRSRFTNMPAVLCEALYRGFAVDLQATVDVDVFVSSFSVLYSDDKFLILKFLARVYDTGTSFLDRSRIEEMFRLAYGESGRGKSEQDLRVLDTLFKRRKEIPVREFEGWQGRLDIFSKWIIDAMVIFVEELPQNLHRLHRKYTSLSDCDDFQSRLSPVALDRLRQQFLRLSTEGLRPVMQLQTYKHYVAPYISELLAEIVFLSRCESVQAVWRLGDFLEHAMVYSASSKQTRCIAIFAAIIKYDNKIRMHEVETESIEELMKVDEASRTNSDKVGEHIAPFLCRVREEDRQLFLSFLRLVHILAHPSETIQALTGSSLVSEEVFTDDVDATSDLVGRKRAHSLNVVVPALDSSQLAQPAVTTVSSHPQILCSWYTGQSLKLALPTPLHAKLHQLLERGGGALSADYCAFILQQCYDLLPGLGELSMSAACLQGLQPTSPMEEKEHIVELTIRHNQAHTVTSTQPYGPPDTEWCVISRQWLDRWRMYVGQQNGQRPGPIDNSTLLLGKALRPAIAIGQDVDLIPPRAFCALQQWYSGGPAIYRRVISVSPEADYDQCNLGYTAALELHPLVLMVVLLDGQGKPMHHTSKELLFSSSATVEAVTAEVAEFFRLTPGSVRLWNYAGDRWKDQSMLTPSQTLRDAGLANLQQVAVEISREDGSWPRAQLHSIMQEGEARGSLTSTPSPVTTVIARRSDGLVGLDNMGNTCYLNASLQALLHTKLLVDYFVQKQHLNDVNTRSKHSYQGRLSSAFAQVVQDVLACAHSSYTPRAFHHVVCALRDQFAGHDQHDAHEFLAFLLDGLSEDLNLVTNKPYTEHPDSNDRPDAALAEEWWENHLKRERSIVQMAFAGQFKSVMSCGCGYNSSRFEVFNVLSLPLPELQHRTVQVLVILRNLQCATRCAVRVPRHGVLQDVIDQVRCLDLRGSGGENMWYIASELSNGRIRAFMPSERRVETLRENEVLTLFEVSAQPRAPPRTTLMSEDAMTTSTTLAALAGVESGAAVPDSCEEEAGRTLVRVAFCQRRVRLVDGAQLGLGGYDYFRPEPFGLPILDVLQSPSTGAQLYELMATRLQCFLRAPVAALVQHHAQMCRSASTYAALSTPSSPLPKSTRESADAPITSSGGAPGGPDTLYVLGGAPADTFSRVQSASTDEVVGGRLPRRGFTLRLVSGGTASSVECSKCAWQHRCQGCVVPDQADVLVDLLDGQSIAVDWHFVVLEDLFDAQMASRTHFHSSVQALRDQSSEASRVPLEKCLEKFTEQERLEGVVCPRCMEDTRMSKAMMLWRLPPILVIQLKRFQFDRTSRRKLTQGVGFPLSELDLSRFLAQKPVASQTYDLYCVIHHLGALGGGHYVATVRGDPPAAKDGEVCVHAHGNDQPLKWYCVNDNMVCVATDREVSGPSAYVLFYLRRDMNGAAALEQLLQSLRGGLEVPGVKESATEDAGSSPLTPSLPVSHPLSTPATPNPIVETQHRPTVAVGGPRSPVVGRRVGQRAVESEEDGNCVVN